MTCLFTYGPQFTIAMVFVKNPVNDGATDNRSPKAYIPGDAFGARKCG